jgi:hypothetical protein
MSFALRRVRAVALATVAAVATALPLAAQATPTAQQLHDKYVAAIGGRAAWDRKVSMQQKQSIVLGAMGNATGELMTARAGRVVQKLVLPFGEILQGYDGTIAWMINPMQGAQIMEGKAGDAMRQAADWRLLTYAPGSYTSATVVGPADFEGRKAWQVRTVPAIGPETMEYFDQETGLRLGATAKVSGEMGEMDVRTVFRDYTAFGDVKLPKTVVVQNPVVGEFTVTVDAVEFDKVPESAFVLPDAIKALRK